MMGHLPDRRLRAFAEVAADLRPPTIFPGENTPESHAGLCCAHPRPPHLPLFPPPEPFPHTRTEGQKHIQNP
jgi:hypothetical protein